MTDVIYRTRLTPGIGCRIEGTITAYLGQKGIGYFDFSMHKLLGEVRGYRLYILEKYRRKGIGTKLYNEGEKIFREHEMKFISGLYLSPEARKFFKKQGLTIVVENEMRKFFN